MADVHKCLINGLERADDGFAVSECLEIQSCPLGPVPAAIA